MCALASRCRKNQQDYPQNHVQIRITANSLCTLCVLRDFVMNDEANTNHRDTENTEVAQRNLR